MKEMAMTEKAHLFATARRAGMLWPGPAGEIVKRYIYEWEEFGYIFQNSSLLAKLIEQVWSTKLPGEEEILPWNEWVRLA